jgi:osmotically-inducible protein OsmY
MDTSFHAQRPRLFAGLAVALLTASCASRPPKSAAQIQADRALAEKGESALDADPAYYSRHVDVQGDDGKVSLSGYVWSNASIVQAERVASRVPGVTSVADQLELERAGATAGAAAVTDGTT